ncbi:hypothetical protein AB0395_47265 [Streptosporangium sp. NPDC051023]|uniref:hypothetical protein n=1 Tax=Streptosporangium sp. NPDC051023 TaxID=3155410 RepID=UPI00344FE394
MELRTPFKFRLLRSDFPLFPQLTEDRVPPEGNESRAHPRDEILALRICKNLLAPMKLITDRLAEGPMRTQIDRWMDLRPQLP